MAICLVVVVVLLIWIMPKMISMVSEDKLPLVTKILLKIKDFIMKDYILIIGIVASLIIFIPIVKRIEAVDLFVSKMKVKMPGIGKLQK